MTDTMQSPTAPTILVVFGATGDLMERKIAPSLFHLHEKGRLPEHFRIVGFARRPFPDDVFRDMMCTAIRGHHAAAVEDADIRAFTQVITYSQGHFDEPEAYDRLAERLREIDAEWGVCANKLFYLAVPPDNYRQIFEHLSSSGLTATCATFGNEGGWTRVIVEKPFGHDARTAQELDELLGMLFEERQIYRIDHYLAKEMLQGIMSFRFSNNLLEPSWSNRAIDRIEIDLLETLGAEDRGGFYDPIGALRDVGQNHLLQMLALITMKQPVDMDADSIRAARVEALEALRPPTPEQIRTHTFRAQYDGYRTIQGVAPGSDTETFFKVVTELDADDWRGVPVVMRGGKRMGSVCKEIVVTFKHPDPCLCDGVEDVENHVTFRLEPADTIIIGFWTKKPGFDAVLEERDFNFLLYEREEKTQYVEEYSRLLVDAIAGDQTLFVSTSEVKAMWAFIDPIVCAWEQGAVPLARYAADTDEPLALSADLGGTPVLDALRREIGLVGLGRMGAGIARNLAGQGWRVVAFNRTTSKTDALAAGSTVEAAHSLADLVSALEPPRTVWLMLPAGQVTDDMLFGEGGLAGLLAPGDTVVDGGNAHYVDDAPRSARLAKAGVRFVDAGVSGGPAGARNGACLMVGGERADFDRLRPLWHDLSVPDGYRHFEGVGAGHFVKMVHNGIEYGMMQAIAEGFAVLRESPLGVDLQDAAEIYDRGSVIESRLVGWLEKALAKHGADMEGVSGSVGHTGEGEWTVDVARELGVDTRVIADALAFRVESQERPSWTGRVLSALREQFGQHPVE
jgi:glucose-6-phosphate 1-dehydrogenase